MFVTHSSLESKLKDKKRILKEVDKIGKVLRALVIQLPYFERRLRGRLRTVTLLPYLKDIYVNQGSLIHGLSLIHI